MPGGTGRGEAKAPPFIAPTPPLRVEMGGEIQGHDDAEAEVEKKARRDLSRGRRRKTKIKFIYVLIEGRKAMKVQRWFYLFRHSFFSFLFSLFTFLRHFLCDE